MELSRHAAIRCQQRGIPPLIRQWLHDYGSEIQTHGATKRFFDREAKRRLAADVGAQVVDRMGSLLNIYIVVSRGTEVTAAPRTRRIKRH